MISKVHFNVHAVSPSTYLMYLFKMGTFNVYRERYSAKLKCFKTISRFISMYVQSLNGIFYENKTHII